MQGLFSASLSRWARNRGQCASRTRKGALQRRRDDLDGDGRARSRRPSRWRSPGWRPRRARRAKPPSGASWAVASPFAPDRSPISVARRAALERRIRSCLHGVSDLPFGYSFVCVAVRSDLAAPDPPPRLSPDCRTRRFVRHAGSIVATHVACREPPQPGRPLHGCDHPPREVLSGTATTGRA